MKKLLFLIISVFLLGWQNSPVNVYQLQFNDLDGGLINMASFKGKKIIVAEYDAINPDRKQLAALDTLYKKNKNNLIVIAIPVTDFGNSASEGNVKKLWKDTLQLSYFITKVSKAKKSNGNSQHRLFRWITNKNENGHFDYDVDNDGEMFMISENGALFAFIKKKINLTGSLMNKLLTQKGP